jgi:hydroxymethylbilane synthase
MGFKDRITADLNPPTMFHAVSQGALGIEVRSDDAEALELCKKLTHRDTQYRCLAERACLRILEGGCSVPVGVATEIRGDLLKLTGCVTSLNGDEHVEHTIEQTVTSPEEAAELGQKLAKVLIETGAKKILDAINVERERRIIAAKAEDEVREAS